MEMTLKQLKEQGGATLHYGKEVQYEDGYQVALDGKNGGHEITIPCEDLDRFEEAFQSEVKPLPSCGIWYNPKNNEVVVDKVSIHVDSFETAVRIANENNQKAIFDWLEQRVINLQDY